MRDPNETHDASEQTSRHSRYSRYSRYSRNSLNPRLARLALFTAVVGGLSNLPLASAVFGSGAGLALGFHQDPSAKTATMSMTKNSLLDMTDTYIEDLESGLSFGFWVRYSTYDTAGGSAPITLVTSTDTNFFQPFGQGFAFTKRRTPSCITDWQWHHYMATWDPTTGSLKSYYDGVFEDELITGVGVSLSAQEELMLAVGWQPYSYGDVVTTMQDKCLGGELDEAMLFSKVLDADEVGEIYNKAFDPATVNTEQPELILYYNMDEVYDGGDGFSYVPNLGTAKALGDKYDLILGSATGQTTWQQSLSGDPYPIVAPAVVKSDAPIEQSGTNPYAVNAVPGTTVTVSIATSGEDVATGLSNVVGADSYSGTDITVTATDSETIVTFDVTDGTTTESNQLHVFPQLAPTCADFEYSSIEDAVQMMRLGWLGESSTMDSLTVNIMSVPTAGTLYQSVEDGTGTRSMDESSPITVPTELVNVEGVLYFVPEADGVGVPYATFTYTVTDESGLESGTCTISINYMSENDLPTVTTGTMITVSEDSDAILISVTADDVEDDALSVLVTELPKKGKLYLTSDGTVNGNLTLIDREYSAFDTGDVISQYVSEVEAVSSFWGGPPYAGYHAFNVIGRATASTGGEGIDDRVERTGGYVVGDVVKYTAEPHSPYALAKIIAVYGADDQGIGGDTATFDIELMYMQRDVGKLNGGAESGEYVECVLQGSTYPDDCDTAMAEANPDGVQYFGVPISDFGALDAAVWCPLLKGYGGDDQSDMSGGEAAAAYGSQYAYTHNQATSYDVIDGTPWTEYITVKFSEPVYPVAVDVGHTRGGHSIVIVEAYHALTDKWSTLSDDSVDVDAAQDQIDRSTYDIWSPQGMCRHSFATDMLRFKLDTSGETGSSDWNYIDYIEFYGATTQQPAIISPGHPNTLVYIPDPDEQGEDSFEFTATDCPGDRRRNADPAAVQQITITASNDKPTVASQSYILLDLTDSKSPNLEISLEGADTDPDDTLTYTLTSMPEVGSLVGLEVGDTIAGGVLQYVPTNPDRDDLSGTICTEYGAEIVSFTFTVTDDATQGGEALTSEPGTIEIILSCEDLNHVDEAALILGFLFMGIDMLCSLGFMAWTLVNFNSRVVKASQPYFLIMITVGALISSTTIYSLSVEDRTSGTRAGEDGGTDADLFCGTAWWTYCIGFVLIFAPLFAKLWRVNTIFNQLKLTSIQIKSGMLVRMIVGLALVDVVILITWNMVDPQRYKREVSTTDTAGYNIESVGLCKSDTDSLFICLIAAFHLALLMWGVRLAYNGRKLETRYHEGKYVSVAMFSNLQVLCLGVPLMVIVSDNPTSNFFIRSGIIFFNDLTVQCFVFVPKIMALHFPSDDPANSSSTRLDGATGATTGSTMVTAANQNTVMTVVPKG